MQNYLRKAFIIRHSQVSKNVKFKTVNKKKSLNMQIFKRLFVNKNHSLDFLLTFVHGRPLILIGNLKMRNIHKAGKISIA